MAFFIALLGRDSSRREINGMNGLGHDVRYAFRMLVRNPGFTLVAVATLAVGIGVNSAIFSVMEAVLLKPLPVRDPESLAFVWERNTKRESRRNVVNPGNFLRWQERNHVFEQLAAFSPWNANVTGGAEPERLDIGAVTGNFFATLGVPAALGRVFTDDDSKPGAPDVVILSDGFWRRRFGADPQAVGQSLIVNDRPQTVVGVLPPGFNLPAGAQLFAPFTVGPDWRDSRGRWLMTVGRLKPGVAIARAQAEMETIAAGIEKERPDFDTGWSVIVAPLHADLVRDFKPALLALAGAVGFVLFIACANVANLLLARAVGRERELAIRSSLGAGSGRLVRQLLTESLVLALLGAAAGLVLGRWALDGLLAIVPVDVSSLAGIRLDRTAVLFTLGLSVASALVFGLVPAWHVTRPALARALKEGGTVAGAGRERRRVTNVLVVSEMALALVLLVGAGLLLKSFWRLSHVDPGFDPRHVLTFQVSLPQARYAEPEKQLRFYREALDRLAALPGVEATGAISWGPMGMGSATGFAVVGQPAPAAGEEPVADVRMVTPGLFAAMGVRLRHGRLIAETDGPERSKVVVVNEGMADQFWPGEDPIGRKIEMEWGGTFTFEVVGVVANVHLTSLETKPRSTLYFPVAQLPNDFMTMMVRSKRSAPPSLATVKAAISAVDPNLPVAEARTLEAIVSRSLALPRFLLLLLAVFSTAAILLAAIGLYGVLSYAVGQRRPEVGVRVALGARPGDIRRLILGEGFALAGLGLMIGSIGAIALSRLFSGLLFEVSATDPAAYVGTAAVLGLAAFFAAWLPARRAAKVDPVVALRAE
jgi:putative ABC transport system permease protein